MLMDFINPSRLFYVYMNRIYYGMSQQHVFRSALGQSSALPGRLDFVSSRHCKTAAPFSAAPLRQRKAVSRQHARRQGRAVVAQAAATAEAALKTDLHGELKKALANVKPKVGYHPNLPGCIMWLSLGSSGLVACTPLWSRSAAGVPRDLDVEVSQCNLQLLIDGEFVDSSSGKTFETEDPRTGEVLVEVAEAQEEDVDRAVKAARKVCASGPY